MVHLDYRSVRPIYVQIVDRFRDQISAGILAPGDKLPSVRELAVQLSINPNTIQRSYHQLESEGWITTMPGKGCFVCGIPQSAVDEQANLYADFDAAVKALLQSGVTIAQLQQRLSEGGNAECSK